MREQKQKKTSLGFTEIAQNVDPTTVMTGRQFVGSFACSLALLFSVISMASGCAMRPHGEIQKHHVQRSQSPISQEVRHPVNTAYQMAIRNQYLNTKFHETK